MRIQFASDLHLEHTDPYHESRMPVFAGGELLLLAGDIDRIRRVFCRFSGWPCPVFYVRGNHDSYFDGYESGISAAAKLSLTGTVKLLERSEMVLAGVRVLGCCLWTDFSLMGRVEDAMLLAQYFGPDYRYLRRADGKLITPEDTKREHHLTVDWLSRTLARPFNGSTVVLTHHAPHIRSLRWSRGMDRLSSAFASNLLDLTTQVDVWVHGHVHHTCDYKLGRCRVVCNPAGRFERPNPHFDPLWTIDVVSDREA